jgi:hypothetical protein
LVSDQHATHGRRWWCLFSLLVDGSASDGTPSYTASEGGKLRCEYDASSPTYIPYADLTEADVLEWVYTSLIEGDETAAEAKARVEADRDAKVQKQIDAAATTASGLPW